MKDMEEDISKLQNGDESQHKCEQEDSESREQHEENVDSHSLSGLDEGNDTESTQVDVDTSQKHSMDAQTQNPRGKKRKKPANHRKNIRKVLKIHQLDPKFLEAQKEEKERLQRLELQRAISEQASLAPAQPDNVEVEKPLGSKHPILIIDEVEDNDIGESTCSMTDDLVESYVSSKPKNVENVILISSSDSEELSGDDAVDSDSSGDCTNLISATNLTSHSKGVLVNVGHFPDEPSICLPPQIARVIKPHQILGIRFLYENLIVSTKNFKTSTGLGCILAHAMGLGKTIQTVSLVHVLLQFTSSRKVLILVPINTLQNWLNEFNVWVPARPHDTPAKGCTGLANVSNRESMDGLQDIPQNERHLMEHCENHATPTSDSTKDGYGSEATDAQTEIDVNYTDQPTYFGLECNEQESSKDAASSCSSKSSEHVDVEYREYEVFLLNDSIRTTVSRANLVAQWNKNGGVLLMGYEMFRMISLYKASFCNNFMNAKGKKRKKIKSTSTIIDIDKEEKEMELMLEMQKALTDPGPDLVVCDEGHRIKNHQSNIHHALHKIRTRRRLVLTGYPLQNNLTEYWCMVDFVRPNYLGSRHEFQNMFERPIINGQCIDSTPADKKLMKYRAHVLSSFLKGFVQRKDYTALKVALPPKEEHVIMVRMSNIQEAIYKRFTLLMQEGYGDQLNPIKIFSVCSKIWNHPDILYKSMVADQSKKAAFFDTDVDVAIEDRAKAKIPYKLAQKQQPYASPSFLNDVGFNPFAGEAKTLLSKITDWAKEMFHSNLYQEGCIENSGKFTVLMQLIKESLSRGDKMLIFSQSLLTLDLIEDVFNRTPVNLHSMEMNQNDQEFWKKNTDYFRIDGNTATTERERLINIFNRKSNRAAKIFLLSTRAGCLGINLIGANRVVVFDVSWNPCHDAQAVCRVYRYGQEKPCYIYRLIASNTMEKRMYYRQISKQGVSDRVIDEMNPVENFSKDELSKLLSTSWDNEPICDFTDSCEVINDSVLKTICQKCSQWIVTLPFQHESLLLDNKSSKLSNKEKREARRGYEEEKKKTIYGMNGPIGFRGSSYAQRGNLSEVMGSAAESPSTAKIQLVSNQMLPNIPMHSLGAPTNTAIENKLPCFQQRRKEDTTYDPSRFRSVIANHAYLPNLLYDLNLVNSMKTMPPGQSVAIMETTESASSSKDVTPRLNPSSYVEALNSTKKTHKEGDELGLPWTDFNSTDKSGTLSSHNRRVDKVDGQSQSSSSATANYNLECLSGIEDATGSHCKYKPSDSSEVICIDSDGDSE